MIIKESFNLGNFEITNYIFFLSLILIVDFRPLRKLCYPKFGKNAALLLGYNLYVLLAAMLAYTPLTTSNIGTIYTLYVIALILALFTNSKSINGEIFVFLMWLSTGIFSLMLFWVITKGGTLLGTTVSSLENGADRLTLSAIAFYHLCAMLIYKANTSYKLIFKVIFAIIAFYDVMACSRRGMMVAFIMILLYHIYQSFTGIISQRLIFNSVKLILIVGVSIAVISSVYPLWTDMVDTYIQRLTIGVNTYFGNFEGGIDAAASNRNQNWIVAPKEYLSGTFPQIIFGRGYSYRQWDIPYLQAFTDLGLIGGLYYLYLQFMYPLKVFRIRTNDLALRFAQYYGIITVTFNLYSGVPYGHYKFVGIALLIYIMEDYKKRKRLKANNEILKRGD